MRLTFIICLALSALATYGQDESANSMQADLMLGFGSGQTNISTSYQVAWKFGKKQKVLMGVGGRINAFFASDKYFVTAPAKLVKGEAGPQALFKEAIPANMDSVLFSSAQVYSVNILLHIGYAFSEKFRAGFNIDVIGASFGGSKTGTYINGSVMTPTSGSPSGFNLLLVGENDLGNLNSEFFVSYALNERWSIKAGIQHIFMEYTTDTAVQQFPEPNDRFRITPTVFCAGAVYTIR